MASAKEIERALYRVRGKIIALKRSAKERFKSRHAKDWPQATRERYRGLQDEAKYLQDLPAEEGIDQWR